MHSVLRGRFLPALSMPAPESPGASRERECDDDDDDDDDPVGAVFGRLLRRDPPGRDRPARRADARGIVDWHHALASRWRRWALGCWPCRFAGERERRKAYLAHPPV